MRAAIYDRYGEPSVMRIGEVPCPTPRSRETLVRVHAASLNPKDVVIRAGKFRWVSLGRFPRMCGYDFAGEIVEIGRDVGGVSVGDDVYGMVNGVLGRTCAELVAVPAAALARKPKNLSWRQAAAVPLVGQTALQALRDDARLRAGQRVCINGASGGVGTIAIQIAKELGAHVIAVCSTRNGELCRSLGADEVVTYDDTDVLDALEDIDVFFDVFGNLPFSRVAPVLTRRGTHVSTIPSVRTALDLLRAIGSRHSARIVLVRSNHRDLEFLRAGLEAERCRVVVDRTYGLDEIEAAHRYLETRRARGKVVIDVSGIRSGGLPGAVGSCS